MPTRFERDLDKANPCEDEIRGKDHLGEHGWPMMSRLTANSLRGNQRDKSRDADAYRFDFSGTAVSFGSASSFTSLQLQKFAMSVATHFSTAASYVARRRHVNIEPCNKGVTSIAPMRYFCLKFSEQASGWLHKAEVSPKGRVAKLECHAGELSRQLACDRLC